MKAAIITKPGGPEVFAIRDVPQPQPAADQVLVRVRASALNRADLLQRQGRYPAPPGFPQDIPGLEFAGEVVACGPDARLWQPGARVFGLTGGGAQAEFLVAPERTLAEVPANLGWAQAAAVPEVFITAHDALWIQAALRPNERVLINAVGSGVGLAATQLARALGAIPFGTSRTPDKIERARGYGLEGGAVVGDAAAELPALAQRWTPAGFDVVLDLVGGPYVGAAIHSLALKGRLILVGTTGGSAIELKYGPMLTRRLTVKGTSLRARPLEEKIAAIQAFAREVLPLLAAGTLKPVVDCVFPLAQIAAAHARLESNETFGKVVIEI